MLTRIIAASFVVLLTSMSSMTTAQSNAPIAAKKAKTLTAHGHDRIDNYYWLNDREDQEVLDYLNAENTYKDGLLAGQQELQTKLFDEIVARIKADDETVPYMKKGYLYSTRYRKGDEHPIHVRKKGGAEGAEEIMLDVNVLAKPFDYYAVGSRTVSPNNKLLVYGEDTLSRRIYTLRFKDLETGEVLPDAIENTAGNVVWAADNQTVFYTVKDETLRPFKVLRHKLGTPVADDVEVYNESDPTFYTYIYTSKNDDYLLIHSAATLTTEAQYLKADNPTGEFKTFEPRNRDAKLEYELDFAEGVWYIKTNKDAVNFKIATTPSGKTSQDNWKDLVPAREDAFVEGMDLFKKYIVVSERIGGIVKQRILPRQTLNIGVLTDHHVDFGEDAYLSYTSTNHDYDTPVVRVGFTSMTTPNSVYDYNVNDKKLTLLKRQEVIGDFDPASYTSERIDVPARDGKMVPLSIVRHKDTPLDGTAPLLLYGYGSYGNSMDPYFSSVRLSLLDRGFVYVVAHIRGGQELGKQWYEDGKLLKKMNTFNDFIDAGKWLTANKYAANDQLYAMGGSAGGLLMGAIINLEPEMWAGIIAAVPFVDVVTTMLDETIPLTTGEFDEWGNPKEKESYDYMLSYSPYDQVEAKAYPNMMVTTGLHDSQVQYWEPAKWVAKLRDMKTDDNQLILHTNMSTGHGGAAGRFERYKETAMEYAWLLKLADKG
ncbi:MAG: S9 family peptidase [Saprospiraceae bacterium]